jgi:hypothetical protein
MVYSRNVNIHVTNIPPLSFLLLMYFSVELINDLVHVTKSDEIAAPRRASRLIVSGGHHTDEVKSVKFASSTTRSLSPNKLGSNPSGLLTSAQPEEPNTIATIRTLLQYVVE